MLRRSVRSRKAPAGRVSNNLESRDFNPPLPTVVGKRRRSLSPPTVPSTPALSTPIPEASAKPLEGSHPRVKRTRMTTRASNNTSSALTEVIAKKRRSLSSPTATSTVTPGSSTTTFEAPPKPLVVSHPRIKHTRMRAQVSSNTSVALPTIPTVVGKRRRSTSPPRAPSIVDPELSISVPEASPTPPEVVSQLQGPQAKRIRTTSTPISIAPDIRIGHEESPAVLAPIAFSPGSHPVDPALQHSTALSNTVEGELPLPYSDAHSQTITTIEPVAGSHPVDPPLSTPIAHSDTAEHTYIDTITPVGSIAALSLLGSVVRSQTSERKEPVAGLASIISSAEPNPAGEPVTAIVAITLSTEACPAGQPMIPEHEESIATIAPIALSSESHHVGQPLPPPSAYPQTMEQQEYGVIPPVISPAELRPIDPLLPPSIAHSKIVQRQELVAAIIPNAQAPGSHSTGELVAPILASAVSHSVNQPLLSSITPPDIIGQQDQVDAIASVTSPTGSHLLGLCMQPSTTHSRTVEGEEIITAIVPVPPSATSHPNDPPLLSSILHSHTIEYSSPEPVISDQSHNPTLTGSGAGSKKRSRSSSLPDNTDSSSTIRPIVPTPHPSAKWTRLDDTESSSPQPSVLVDPPPNSQRRFGLASRRKIRNYPITISQEAMLAQVKSQTPATGSRTSGSPFYQNPAEHPTLGDINILGNDNGLPQDTNTDSAITSREQREHNLPTVDKKADNPTNLVSRQLSVNSSILSNGSPGRQLESSSSLPLSIPPSQPSIPVASGLSLYTAQSAQPDKHLQTSLVTIGPSPPNGFPTQPIQSTQCVQDLATTPVDPFPSSRGFSADLATTPIVPSPLNRPSILVSSSSSTIPSQSTQPARHFLASSTTASPSPPMQLVERSPDLVKMPVDPSPLSRPSVLVTSSSIPSQSMQPAQPLQASSTPATIASPSSVLPAQQATSSLFNPIDNHERRKVNIVKVMENLQKMPDTLEIAIPVNASSSNLTGDISEDDNDIYMADYSDSDDIDMANCSDDDDIYMTDHSDRNEHVDHGKENRRSILVNRDAFETYEMLIKNPDAPCNNAAVATVIEMFVDLQSHLKTVLKSATSHMNPLQPGNSAGQNRRGKALPKVTFEIRHQDKVNLDLQNDVRVLAKELLNSSEVPLRVPTVQELRLFAKKDHGAIGPQIQNFILDLDSTGLASPWNKRATSIFAAEFLTREEFTCRDRDAIEHTFKTHLKALQTQYKRQANAVTIDEAGRIAQLDNTKRSIRYAQRTYKRHRRCNSMNRFAHIPGVDKVIEELQRIPVDAMSGDETEYDNDGKPYLIKTRCEWRDKEADDLFEICDSLDLSTRFDSDDRPGRGRFPDIRVSSGRPDARHAPPRLPKNFYNAAYKDDLTADEEIKLAMRPAFKFLIPAQLLRHVV